METVAVRIHGELNDFLPRQQRCRPIIVPARERSTAKDMIEALGVPHPEIEALLANGKAIGFGYLVEAADRLDALPYSALDSVPIDQRLPLRPPFEPRFVLDQHLGALARYLRLLGFDTDYRNDYHDSDLAATASHERRILLTRDRGLLKRAEVVHGYYLRSTAPRLQVAEVLRRYDLFKMAEPYRRCIRCNGILRRVSKHDIESRLAPKTRQHFSDFHLCSACGQIYWKGSHYSKMEQLIAAWLGTDG